MSDEKKFMKLPMGTKRQFKMYLDDDLVERLRRAAEKIGKDSGQEVAEEVLAIYLPVWASVNDATRRAIDYQTKIIGEETRVKSERKAPAILNGVELAPHSKRKIPMKNTAVELKKEKKAG
jgi:hypothetical protein